MVHNKTILTSDQLATNLGILTTHLRFYNSLELRELRKVLVLQTQFCYKGYNSWTANEDTYRARFGGLPVQSRIRACHPPDVSVCSPTRKFHWASVSRVSIGVQLHRHSWFSHWLQNWIQFPAPSHTSLGKGLTQSPNPLITWLVFLVTSLHPESSHL